MANPRVRINDHLLKPIQIEIVQQEVREGGEGAGVLHMVKDVNIININLISSMMGEKVKGQSDWVLDSSPLYYSSKISFKIHLCKMTNKS